MKKTLIAILMALALALVPVGNAFAATTADVTVTATPAFISITLAPGQTTWPIGVVTAGSTPSTTTTYFTIDNTSTVQTDQTIGVTTATWSGGVTWAHAEDAVPGTDLAGLKANKGGTWGVSDIIVKNASPNFIAENQTANTDYSFGLKLWAPTEFTDGVEKQIIVRITAVAG